MSLKLLPFSKAGSIEAKNTWEIFGNALNEWVGRREASEHATQTKGLNEVKSRVEGLIALVYKPVGQPDQEETLPTTQQQRVEARKARDHL
jgi:hypothetical protein